MKNITSLESRLFSTLSNPKRLEILHLLCHGTATVNELVDMTNIAQANVSQHLSVLRRLGLVTSTKEAQTRRYCLASKHIEKLMSTMRLFLLEKYGVKDVEKLHLLHIHTDPVCGMEVAAHQAAATYVHNHKRYYFCGLGCEQKFQLKPSAFIVENAQKSTSI